MVGITSLHRRLSRKPLRNSALCHVRIKFVRFHYSHSLNRRLCNTKSKTAHFRSHLICRCTRTRSGDQPVCFQFHKGHHTHTRSLEGGRQYCRYVNPFIPRDEIGLQGLRESNRAPPMASFACWVRAYRFVSSCETHKSGPNNSQITSNTKFKAGRLKNI